MNCYKFAKLSFVFLFLVFIASYSFAQTIPSTQYSRDKARAMELYTKKQFIESYQLLMKLLRENPADTDITLGVARAATSAKKYNQAIMAYEKLIAQYPKKGIYYVELANVYLLMEDFEQAKKAIEKGRELNPELNVNFDKIIGFIESRLQTSFLSGALSVGYGYETNPNSGPEAANVIIGGLPLVISDDSLPHASSSVSVSAILNYMQKPKYDSNFAFISDIGFYGKYFTQNEVSQNNFIWFRYGMGLRAMYEEISYDIIVKSDIAMYSGQNNVFSAGLEFKLNSVILNNLTSTTFLGADLKNYNLNKSSNGGYYVASQTFRWSFVQGSNLIGALKYSYKDSATQRMTYNSADVSLRLLQNIVGGLYITPYANYQFSLYNAPATVLETSNRQDDQIRAGVSLAYYINSSVSVDGYYEYLKNMSNSPIYKYNDQIVGASLNYYF